METISLGTVLDFLTWLSDSTNMAPAMVLAHYAVFSNPLKFGLKLHIPERALSLVLKGINAARELRHQPVLTWSLHRVQQHMTFNGVPLEESHLLHRATFLLALATRYIASQLAALLVHSSPSLLE